eukprot:snap_masked-scaffold277_size226016-processed-gene-1.4 protein:Tk10756 transcript:snap_masked-scaffold277_size226016-processed-gene-1.4-mRNA-1 annotation:"zinc transporter zip13-like"
MFGKKSRVSQPTPELPPFPTLEEIEADLEAGAGDDPLCVTQVPEGLDFVSQFQPRFQHTQSSSVRSSEIIADKADPEESSLYDKTSKMSGGSIEPMWANQTYFANYWIGLINRDSLIPSIQLVHNPWLYAIICSTLVGLSGLFPVLLISLGKTDESRLKFMLSFACGGLLGDVFLHLLPEAYERLRHVEDIHTAHTMTGLWILAGILAFTVIELLCKDDSVPNGDIKVEGYLNLAANCIDNFAHGLAVGGAFLVDNKTGFTTTACILMHEIPHEIGDFAILMRAGFSKVDAAKAQLSTASLGILGALAALFLDSYLAIETYTAWIIPFTSGGFLHIALVGVLPDLMKSTSLADNVIAHQLNLERIKSLRKRLASGVETLEAVTPRIEAETEDLRQLAEEAKAKLEEVQSLKAYSKLHEC